MTQGHEAEADHKDDHAHPKQANIDAAALAMATAASLGAFDKPPAPRGPVVVGRKECNTCGVVLTDNHVCVPYGQRVKKIKAELDIAVQQRDNAKRDLRSAVELFKRDTTAARVRELVEHNQALEKELDQARREAARKTEDASRDIDQLGRMLERTMSAHNDALATIARLTRALRESRVAVESASPT